MTNLELDYAIIFAQIRKNMQSQETSLTGTYMEELSDCGADSEPGETAPLENTWEQTVKKRDGPLWLSILTNSIYFLFIAGILLLALHFTAANGIQTVLGIQMSYAPGGCEVPDIQEGSLVISRAAELQDYRQGDTVTYKNTDGNTGIGVIDSILINYRQTGQPAYKMRGQPDSADPIGSVAVAGIVTFTVPVLGAVMNWMGNNILLVAIFFVVAIEANVILIKKFKVKTVNEELKIKSIPAPPKKKASFFANIAFYLALFAVLVLAVAYGGNNGVRSLFGYSYFNVLTRSMQSEIPQNSLVLVKKVEPDSIHVGDDITYMREDKTTITHRVIEIYENYEETGAKGFKTQGIENNIPDHDIVLAANVVGAVQFHIPYLGAALQFLAGNIWFVAVMFLLFLILSVALQVYIAEGKKKKMASA